MKVLVNGIQRFPVGPVGPQGGIGDQSIYLKTATVEGGRVALAGDTAVYLSSPAAATTYAFDASALAPAGRAVSFELLVTLGATAYKLTFPATVTWLDDAVPDLSAVSTTHWLAFRSFDGGATWVGNKQGEV